MVCSWLRWFSSCVDGIDIKMTGWWQRFPDRQTWNFLGSQRRLRHRSWTAICLFYLATTADGISPSLASEGPGMSISGRTMKSGAHVFHIYMLCGCIPEPHAMLSMLPLHHFSFSKEVAVEKSTHFEIGVTSAACSLANPQACPKLRQAAANSLEEDLSKNDSKYLGTLPEDIPKHQISRSPTRMHRYGLRVASWRARVFVLRYKCFRRDYFRRMFHAHTRLRRQRYIQKSS